MQWLHFALYALFFFFKQKTAYEMRISDWSSDVCSSDLMRAHVRCVRIKVIDAMHELGAERIRVARHGDARRGTDVMPGQRMNVRCRCELAVTVEIDAGPHFVPVFGRQLQRTVAARLRSRDPRSHPPLTHAVQPQRTRNGREGKQGRR